MKLSIEKTFFYSTLLFAFTMPLSRAAVSFFIIWFVLLFLAQRNFKASWEAIKSSKVFTIMGLFLALMFISIIWSSNIHLALNQIRLYSYWIIIPILAVSLKKEWLPSIVTAFLGGMFVSEIIAYGIFFDLWSVNGRTHDYPTPFMSHIHYSIFLAFTSILLLNRLLSNRYNTYTKIPIFIFFLTSTGNLMVSTGRIGQLAFFVAIAIATIIHFRLTIKSVILFMVISSFLFISAYSSIGLFNERTDKAIEDIRKLESGNYDSSWGDRVAFWIITGDILKDSPLFGKGIGDFELAAAEAIKANPHGFTQPVKDFVTSNHFHNQYLMILVQTGIIGFILMIWLFIELFRLQIEDPEMREIKILGLAIYVVGCIAEPLWIMQFPIIIFVFIAVLSINASRTNNTFTTQSN